MLNFAEIKWNKAEEFAEKRSKFLATLAKANPNFTMLEELILLTKGKLKKQLIALHLQVDSEIKMWDLIEILSIDSDERQAIATVLSQNI